jgi:hypothetical protein
VDLATSEGFRSLGSTPLVPCWAPTRTSEGQAWATWAFQAEGEARAQEEVWGGEVGAAIFLESPTTTT